MERNAERFRQIADIIEFNQTAHRQATWSSGQYEVREIQLSADPTDVEEISCGTTQCVAGWSWVLAGRGKELVSLSSAFDSAAVEEIMSKAACDLGLDRQDAYDLFNTTYNFNDEDENAWPQILRDIADGVDVREAIVSHGYTPPSDGSFAIYARQVMRALDIDITVQEG
jgi:hypothetical protein